MRPQQEGQGNPESEDLYPMNRIIHCVKAQHKVALCLLDLPPLDWPIGLAALPQAVLGFANQVSERA